MRARKNFLIGAASFFLAALLIGGLVLWRRGYFTTRMEAFTEKDFAAAAAKMHGAAPPSQAAPERIEPGRRIRLAIGSIGLPEEQQSRNVSGLVLAQLNGAKGLEMIERQSLDKVLAELQLSKSGLVRAKDAVRAGKLLRADWFLLGTPATVNGANVAVVRIVDARTGVMRDAAMIPTSADTQTLASNLTAFARQSRQDAANPRPKTYLAIGGFEDLSLNNRRAALPDELRSYLTAAYQKSGVTMLEREFVNTLLREMYLDLAGLTEESATTAPKPMQAAYWMVDGHYQSYETTNLQVEIALSVRRFLGRSQHLAVREKPGEPVYRSVKANMDRVMAQDNAALVFSRLTEVRSLLESGKELARFGTGREFIDYVWVSYEGYGNLSENEMARRARNAREAIRNFETALLLDPGNREARICLATCFRKTFMERLDEARDYYRQVIDMPIEDRWSDFARQALLHSFEWPNPSANRLQWFETASSGTTNPAAVTFYQAQAKRADEEATIRRGGTPEAERLAEERLFEELKSFDSAIHGHSGTIGGNLGMDHYAQALGKDKAEAASRLAELYPKMRAQFPDAAPYLLATIITFQVDTNAPVFEEFYRTLDWCVENAKKLPTQGMTFWSHVHSAVFYWAIDHKYYPVALKVMEAISRGALADAASTSYVGGADGKMELAFCYLACQQWSNSLSIFELYTNRPIEMHARGLWGDAFTVVLPNKQAAICREKLGLPKLVDAREFELGEPCIHFHDPKRYSPTWGENPMISADSDGLWIGINHQLMRVDFELRTNFVAEMPFGVTAPFGAIHVGLTKIWLGTSGSGLVEFDKATKESQSFAEKDGLLMNYISALRVIGDTLWIGYGNESGGGLGRLDLKTRVCTSFSTSLSGDSGAARPPRSTVTEIRPGSDGDIWFMAKSTATRYRVAKNDWEVKPGINGVWVICYELDGERFIRALRPMQSGTGELEVEELRDGSKRRLPGGEALPSFPTTLTLNGHDLWVGGQGFVALVDLEQGKIRKLAYVSARSVDWIQSGGGYLWVRCDKHLYRARL